MVYSDEQYSHMNTRWYSYSRIIFFHPNTIMKFRSYKNYFLQAQKIRRMIQSDFDRVFKRPNPLHLINKDLLKFDVNEVDVLITPVAISTAPKIKDCLATNVNESNN